jgi:hypothetical protein
LFYKVFEERKYNNLFKVERRENRMGRNLIVGLALLVSILSTGVLGGCAATPNIIKQKKDEAAVIFLPSGKGLRKDVAENIKRYWRSCGISDDPEDKWRCNKTRPVDRLYLEQCVDSALPTLQRQRDGSYLFYAPDPNYTTRQ